MIIPLKFKKNDLIKNDKDQKLSKLSV